MTKRGWWRRNAVALVAVAVMLPATAIATGYNEWNDYYSGGRPVQPITVAAGDEVTFAGAQWGTAQIELADADDPRAAGVPDDARLVVTTVNVPDGAECLPPMLHEATGLAREWKEARNAELDWRTSDGATSYCSIDQARHQVETPFVVPADATGPFWLDLSIPSELPRFLRFALGD